jgi:predicted transcriptional regulator
MVKTNLRLPDAVYEQIKQLAEREHRSINAQMVIILQKHDDLLDDPARETIKRLAEQHNMSKSQVVMRALVALERALQRQDAHPILTPEGVAELRRATDETRARQNRRRQAS